MNRQTFDHELFRLMEAFRASNKVSTVGAEIYFEGLSDCPGDVFAKVCRQAIRTCKWFPTVAELREIWTAIEPLGGHPGQDIDNEPTLEQVLDEIRQDIGDDKFRALEAKANPLAVALLDNLAPCLDRDHMYRFLQKKLSGQKMVEIYNSGSQR